MESSWVDFTSMVTIVVANTGTQYQAHKHVLCDKSPFIRACLKEHTKEAQEQTINIKEWDDDTAMRTLITWMYQGRPILRIPVSILDATTDDSKNMRDSIQQRLVSLYILADRFVIRELKNSIVDCFLAVLDYEASRISLDAACTLFEHGPADCKLSSLLSCWAADGMSYMLKKPSPRLLDKEEKRLLQQLADSPSVARFVLPRLLDGTLLKEWKLCDYHEHDTEEDSERCEGKFDWVELEDGTKANQTSMEDIEI